MSSLLILSTGKPSKLSWYGKATRTDTRTQHIHGVLGVSHRSRVAEPTQALTCPHITCKHNMYNCTYTGPIFTYSLSANFIVLERDFSAARARALFSVLFFLARSLTHSGSHYASPIVHSLAPSDPRSLVPLHAHYVHHSSSIPFNLLSTCAGGMQESPNPPGTRRRQP